MVSYDLKTIEVNESRLNVGVMAFDSISEIVAQGKTWDNRYVHGPMSQMRSDRSWNGGAFNYEEAQRLMYEQTKISDDIGASLFNAPVKGQKKITRRVVGSIPNVSLSTMGIPNCMVTKEVRNEKVTKIYVDLSGHCGESANTLANRFKPKVDKIAEYMRSSDKVEIYYYDITADRDHPRNYGITLIKVKSKEQPLSVTRMMAPLTNAVLFRVFMLPAIEVLYRHHFQYCPYALGQPYQGEKNVTMMTKVFGSMDKVYI